MITAWLTLLSALAGASQPSTLRLKREGTYWNRGGVTSVDVFQDTAVFVVGNSLVKAVLDNGIRVVDSIAPPTAHRWDLSKYLDLGSGLGVLSVRFNDGANMGKNDSAIYLVDWSRPKGAGRWVATRALGPSNISCMIIDGTVTGAFRAVFARSEGLYPLRVLTRAGQTRPDSLVLDPKPKGLPELILWKDVSVHPRGLVVRDDLSSRVQVWGPSPVAGDSSDFRKVVLLDSSWSAARSRAHKVFAMDLPGTWMAVHSNGRVGYVNRLRPAPNAGTDSIALPDLASDEYQRFQVPAYAVRGKSGLMLVASDSTKAVLEQDANGTPRVLATFPDITTIAAAFGDTTFWHATSTVVGAWKMTRTGISSKASRLDHDRSWSLRSTGGRWHLTGSVGTEFAVRAASGRMLATIRIGSDGKAILPSSRGILLVRGPDGTGAVAAPR
ncbi:MAG: hypothetical protein IPN71_06440 [Fibrobacteres bacterium]|jgi:hypothetical protein|nr:hypothetical protein [Fibrobacterota bacterium]